MQQEQHRTHFGVAIGCDSDFIAVSGREPIEPEIAQQSLPEELAPHGHDVWARKPPGGTERICHDATLPRRIRRVAPKAVSAVTRGTPSRRGTRGRRDIADTPGSSLRHTEKRGHS